MTFDKKMQSSPLAFPSPKVGPASDSVDSWYRYYAGFSAAFVDYALTAVAPRAASVLDPWNGTGTTSVRAAGRGLTTYGFDVNPATVVIARARMLGAGVGNSISSLSSDIADHADPVRLSKDPLTFWFSATAASHLRGLQMSVHRLLVDSADTASSPVQSVATMSTLAAFFYTALFRTVRILVAPAAGTNPTWWKEPAETDKLRPRCDEILKVFRESAVELGRGLHREKFNLAVDVTLGVADCRHIPLKDSTVDAIVSSPPYCTRIDYAISTRPELAVLRYEETSLTELRSQLVGTPTMTGECAADELIGPAARALLKSVACHQSRASSGYYLKYYRQYYAAMAGSLAELRRVLKPGGPCVLVVQDTFYKELRNDTPGILLEIATKAGFQSGARHDFTVPRTKASMNPKTRAYRMSSAAIESVLVLR